MLWLEQYSNLRGAPVSPAKFVHVYCSCETEL